MAENFDLLIKGAALVDPHQGISGSRDIGIRDGKIASIVLVRSELDPAKGQTDPQCWTR